MGVIIRIDTARRDELARIAADDLGGVSMDEALRLLIVVHRTHAAFPELAADPAEASSSVEGSAAQPDIDIDVQD